MVSTVLPTLEATVIRQEPQLLRPIARRRQLVSAENINHAQVKIARRGQQ